MRHAYLEAVDETRQDDGTCALDIIVEAEAAPSHPLQDCKGRVGLEVLKLDQAAGPAFLDRLAGLLHDLQVFLALN